MHVTDEKEFTTSVGTHTELMSAHHRNPPTTATAPPGHLPDSRGACFFIFSTGVSSGGHVRAGSVLLLGGDAAPALAAAGEDLAEPGYRARPRVPERTAGVRVREQPLGAVKGERGSFFFVDRLFPVRLENTPQSVVGLSLP